MNNKRLIYLLLLKFFNGRYGMEMVLTGFQLVVN